MYSERSSSEVRGQIEGQEQAETEVRVPRGSGCGEAFLAPRCNCRLSAPTFVSRRTQRRDRLEGDQTIVDWARLREDLCLAEIPRTAGIPSFAPVDVRV